MGEAKRRGSFEQRQAEGQIKRAEEQRERERQRAEYEASLTPEQKRKRHEARLLLTTVLGMTAGFRR